LYARHVAYGKLIWSSSRAELQGQGERRRKVCHVSACNHVLRGRPMCAGEKGVFVLQDGWEQLCAELRAKASMHVDSVHAIGTFARR